MLMLLLLQVTGSQSMMNPAGPATRRISTLGWIVFLTFLIISFIMWIIIFWIGVRRRGTLDKHDSLESEGGQNWILAGGLLVPLAVLTVMFILNLDVLSTFPMRGKDPPPSIVVVGHQWWWEVRYVSGPVDTHFTTADEIHIPINRMVDIELLSADVIHSFWVPRLHGKEDLIPGQPNMIRIRADRPGVYRGQCAEFCGAQHAHMGLLVIAQEPAAYNAWLAHERQPASEPTTPDAKEGEQVFLSGACALCHAVRGTPAGGDVAPDLTHIASRKSLGADTLVNDTSNLEAWITHAQSLKPGVAMPDLTEFSGTQLRDLVAYLQQLH
jgi:cytochrome c oxidase subunit 2